MRLNLRRLCIYITRFAVELALPAATHIESLPAMGKLSWADRPAFKGNPS